MQSLKLDIRTVLRKQSLLGGLAVFSLVLFAMTGSAGAATTIDWRFYDFFNVEPAEHWDARHANYDEHPIGAECFTAVGITNGECVANKPGVPDLPSYPYTYYSYNAVFASHRVDVTGVEVPGYTLDTPVFLPVFNSGEAAGNLLEIEWAADFIDNAVGDQLAAMNCTNQGIAEGYATRLTITVTMDLQESRRLFGVDAADAAAAQAWWNSGIHSNCNVMGSIEQDIYDWFEAMGGNLGTPGKYDIMNAYEWYLEQFYVQMTATVDPDGTTHVTIDGASWGGTNLINRMFYWGDASYLDNYLNSPAAAGWAGYEPWAWFEDMTYTATYTATHTDFQFDAVVPYSLELFAEPGPDGNLDQVDDFAVWKWSPILHDSYNDLLGHNKSELDRYTGAAASELEKSPGSSNYGSMVARQNVPITWDLAAGETWTFEFPTGDVVFYDPNLTPIGADPEDEYVAIVAPLALYETKPAAYGSFNSGTNTWTVTGPSATGGPDGSPGNYALEGWGAISLAVASGGPAVPALSSLGIALLCSLLALAGVRRFRD
jgi:hypothetical protein